MMFLPVCMILVLSATCNAEKVTKKDKRGLYDYAGTLGGYGVGGQLSVRGTSGLGFADGLSGPLAPVHIGTNVHTTITKQYAVPVPHPVPVPVERHVPVPYPHPVPVEVPRPYPVAVPKPYPVPVDRPYPVPVDRPYGVPVPHPVPVHVPAPYPVGIPKPYPVGVPHPVGVPQPYPVPYGGYGFAPYPIRPYLRTEGVGLGLGSSIVH